MMSLRALAVSGLAVAGLLLTVPAAQAAGPVQLTGTQLASRLLPVSYFPSAYKIDKSMTYNSGNRLERGPVKHHLATIGCKKYLINGLPRFGFGETATVGSGVGRRSPGQEYVQGVWQFASSAKATAFYRQYYAFTQRCRTIAATIGKDKVGLTTRLLKKTHVGRYPAFRALQIATLTGFPPTVNDTTITLAGTDVYVINAVGNKEPTKPTVPAALLHLIARVHTFTPRVPA
jgi:hypothetical protein